MKICTACKGLGYAWIYDKHKCINRIRDCLNMQGSGSNNMIDGDSHNINDMSTAYLKFCIAPNVMNGVKSWYHLDLTQTLEFVQNVDPHGAINIYFLMT